ncbi:hypothetical protein PIROE2DRAFT_12191 [Piromyces sp. E2]|nr:hypothetical protein PIROE2DRAFT_12191 [Piromyces sp. E2]|eukprot:OUM61736.1 hypothetical protein PIROE2DRAFT_12191 [Piromyces sp. E2]
MIHTFTDRKIKNIQVLQDINFNVHKLMRLTRLHSFSLILKTELYYDYNIQRINSVLDIIEDTYIPILKKYSLKPASKYPVIVYSTDSSSGKTESEYVHLNGYELMRKIIVWTRGITNTTVSEWLERIESGENILLEYRFRTLEDNYQEYFYNVFQETIETIYNDEISSENVQIYIIYSLTGVLIVLSIAINFLGITPLYNNSKKLHEKTLRMFKYLLKGSINDIISKFEVGIESITETYDISFDNKKNKTSSVENQNIVIRVIRKIKGLIINILLLGSVMLLSIPIIGERKTMILNINVYQYETLLQDIRSYLPGVAESYLNKEIERLENMQLMIYQGKLGLESTTKMRYLDSLLIDQKCRLEEDVCDTIVEVPSIEVTKNIVKLGLNELIEEFIDKAKATLYGSHIIEFKNEDHMYGSIIESNLDFILKCFDDGNFLFQFNTADHVIGALTKFDDLLYDNLFQSLKSVSLYLVFIVIGGTILIIISFFITYRTIKLTSDTLNELVNMIFIIPTSTINMIPQFKRFIETGSFEEE